VAGNEKGCCTICIRLSDLSEGKGGTSETRWDSTVVGCTSVEMGQHLNGLCNPFATNF